MRYWMRFFSPGADARPVTVPAPCEWWCSGMSSEGESVICALVTCEEGSLPPWNALAKWWPGLLPESAIRREDSWRPGDRFPPTEPSDDGWREVVLNER